MEKLKSYFESVGFDDTENNKIVSCFKKRLFDKGDYFVKEGKKSSQMGFIEEGQFQYFSITNLGEERTTYISLQNTFVASLLTYLTETPARENIRALTNSTLWVIQKTDVVALQNQIPGFKDLLYKPY